MEIAHADQLDRVRLAVGIEHGRNVDQMAIPVDDSWVAQLLQQDAGKADMQTRHIGVLPRIAGRPLVAVDNLFGLPGVGIEQQLEVSRRLVHV